MCKKTELIPVALVVNGLLSRLGGVGMNGLKVLIVEDCYLMASALGDLLANAGAQVVGTANSVASAFRILAVSPVDIACLDINLGKENSFPIADELTARGIPFVFVSAYDSTVLPAAYRERPFVDKVKVSSDLLSTCRTASRQISAEALV